MTKKALEETPLPTLGGGEKKVARYIFMVEMTATGH